MKFKKYLKSHKILLLNVVLSIYVATNLIGGERGLVSYFKKNEIMEKLKIEEKNASAEGVQIHGGRTGRTRTGGSPIFFY